MNPLRVLLVVAVLLSVLVVTCGSDDDASETASPSPSVGVTASRPAPTPRPPSPTPTPNCSAYGAPYPLLVVDAQTGQLSEPDAGVIDPYGVHGAWYSGVTHLALACAGGEAVLFNPVTGEIWNPHGGLALGGYYWSPDGEHVALAEAATADPVPVESTVSIIELDSGDGVKVWSGGGARAIRWSADGQYLAFASEVIGDGGSATTEVFVYDRAGILLRKSASSIAVELLDVSVDGTIAFASSPLVGVRELAVADASGAVATIFSTEYAIDRLTWSPDGATLAFSIIKLGSNADLYLWSEGLEEPRVIAGAWYPAWSPDGARLVFVDDFCRGSHVVVSDASGGNQRVLSQPVAANVSDVAWSRDASRIAFNAETGPDFGLWVVNADGSGLTKLTQPAPVGLGWSHDGASLYGILAGGRDFCLFGAPTGS